MTSTTDRLALPLLAAAQAQKEVTHNEALAMLDMLVQPVVTAVGTAAPPAAVLPGQGWIVGPAATGAWAGNAGALAVWTAGGWRFVPPFEGMTVWSCADSATCRYGSAGWAIGVIPGSSVVIGGVQVLGPRAAAIAASSGGASSTSRPARRFQQC